MQELVYKFVYENTGQQYHGTSSTAVVVQEPQVISEYNVRQAYEYCDPPSAGSYLRISQVNNYRS